MFSHSANIRRNVFVTFLVILSFVLCSTGSLSVVAAEGPGAPPPPPQMERWPDAVVLDEASGWKWSAWFGYFSDPWYPWFYHRQLGFLYREGSSTSDLYLYSSKLGWMWTTKELFPTFYSFSRGKWMWFDRKSSSPAWVADLETGSWHQYDLP